MSGRGERARRSALRELAHRVGIVPEYLDQSGRETRVTSDDTRVALLAAMGIDAADDGAARRALEELDRRERDRPLAPVRVARGAAEGDAVPVRVPDGWTGDVECTLTLVTGDRTHETHGGVKGRVRADAGGVLSLPLPVTPEPGYHAMRVRLRHGGDERDGEQTLIVAPRSCRTPAERVGARGAFGITANLYTVRSARNWGVGDFSDLAELLRWAGEIGAAFVGVNPLHALRNTGQDISPYSPVSRLFRNILYLDVAAVPELAESEEARALLESPAFAEKLAALRDSDRVHYDRLVEVKQHALALLFRTFVERHRDAASRRGAAFREYVESQGEPLRDFATFLTLEGHIESERLRDTWRRLENAEGAGPGRPGRAVLPHDPRESQGWRGWPEEYRHPRSPALQDFRARNRDWIDFHCWVQFELDRQLGEAARAARGAGLPVGLYQDLAIGSSPNSSDAWAFQDLFASGVSLGAPPDEYSASGQNWGLPPLNPLRLPEDRYRYITTLFRSALRHAGALRIDHILGFFRQFWIPDGKEGKDGAYVRFPTDDLLGVLALESARAGALVVGEDLGTVPPEVPPTLKDWCVLGSKVLYFEREHETGFRPAADYEPLSLTSANTHDMATVAGFWAGRDIALRRSAGIIDDAAAEKARAVRDEERHALIRRLAEDGALPAPEDPSSGAELRGAVHDFLCRTPAALVALALDDLAGEVEPVNLPGVGMDKYPSWQRRMRLPLERLRDGRDVAAALGGCPAARGDDRTAPASAPLSHSAGER